MGTVGLNCVRLRLRPDSVNVVVLFVFLNQSLNKGKYYEMALSEKTGTIQQNRCSNLGLTCFLSNMANF